MNNTISPKERLFMAMDVVTRMYGTPLEGKDFKNVLRFVDYAIEESGCVLEKPDDEDDLPR